MENRDYRNASEWMKGKGPESDVVMSSRIRLARNLAGHNFPGRALGKELVEVRDKITEAVKVLPSDFKMIRLEDLTNLERQTLVERHLISIGHAQEGPGKLLIFDEEEKISIMVNEEDHLRLQILLPGLTLEEAMNKANELDDALEAHLDFAFNEKFGYLTSCPTNVGTGLRASVMAHLPGLKITGALGQTLNLVSRLGLAVRGLYGEGTESFGDIFQLSNQMSLGVSEKEVLANMLGIISQVIDQERQAREAIVRDNAPEIRDKISRAYGLLANAYKISTQEALDLLSDLKLGIELNLIKNIDGGILNKLMVLIRPATLQAIKGEELTPVMRDIKRAELIRQKIAGGEINVW